MRFLLAAAALVGGLALSGATLAQGDHAYVFGGVNISRGAGSVVGYRSQFTPCSGTSCSVTVAIGKRDYGRFVKWCGAASREVTVNPGSFGSYVECKGPNPWIMLVHVGMHNASDVLTTHSAAVSITVNVTPDAPPQ